MKIFVKDHLLKEVKNQERDISRLIFPDIEIDPQKIKVIMINEGPPENPDDFFYSLKKNPSDMTTTRELFLAGGVEVQTIYDILKKGIYITTAIKSPKESSAVPLSQIQQDAEILEKELKLFPNLKVIMLMGDVAIKSLNYIARKENKKPAISPGSTYKIRKERWEWKGLRIFPSYIMTGKNILIEKSKREMIAEDIHHMMEEIKK